MRRDGSVKPNKNLAIANSIFTPTLTTAAFFIAFLFFRPTDVTGEILYLWAGLGSLAAVLIGFIIGYRFRYSETLNLFVRWLILILMVMLIAFAAYRSFLDIKTFL